MSHIRAIVAVACSVALEALRRKEIHLLLVACFLLIAFTLSLDFFGLPDLVKFYREIALRLMGVFTSLAVVLLAVRQLPREFEQRTIYPLLARPLPRGAFILGKALGVLLVASLCYSLFMLIYIAGMWSLGADMAGGLLLQHLYLQMLQVALLTSMAFLLSLLATPNAALTFALLFYFTAGVISHVSLALYEFTEAAGRILLHVLTYLLPQFILFDLSGKVVHSELWPPLSLSVMLILTAYALTYSFLYGLGAYALFRRRPL